MELLDLFAPKKPKPEPKGCWNCGFARIEGKRPQYKPETKYRSSCLLEPGQGVSSIVMHGEYENAEVCRNHMGLMKGQI